MSAELAHKIDPHTTEKDSGYQPKISNQGLRQHLDLEKSPVEIRLLEDIPGIKDFKGLMVFYEEQPGLHPCYRFEGNELQPYYYSPQVQKIIDMELCRKGVVPLLYFPYGASNAFGKQFVFGVRPHIDDSRVDSSMSFHECDYTNLVPEAELKSLLHNEIMPNLQGVLNWPTPLTEEDISFVVLPNDQFKMACKMTTDPDERRRNLGIIDGQWPSFVVCRQFLNEAFEQGASDLHLDPMSDVSEDGVSNFYRAMLRVDGDLVSLDYILDDEAYGNLVNFICGTLAQTKSYNNNDILSEDITFEPSQYLQFTDDPEVLEFRKMVPAGGASFFPRSFEGKKLRLERVPVINGNAMTMRIVDNSKTFNSLHELSYSATIADTIHTAAKEQNGLILFTGPTGSGKTTSLYALLRTASAGRVLITAENPPEQNIKGIRQLDLERARKNGEEIGFKEALSSMMRQDPDQILVGEIRDEETANAVFYGCQTGHIVYSTLHTNNAIGAPSRLFDLGIRHSLVVDQVNAVVSQKLIPSFNPNLIYDHQARAAFYKDVDIAADLNALMGQELITEPLTVMVPNHEACDRKGINPYAGRLPLVEVLTLDNHLKELLASKPSEQELEAAAGLMEYNPYARYELEGLYRVLLGQTSLEKYDRVCNTGWMKTAEGKRDIMEMVRWAQHTGDDDLMPDQNYHLGEMLRDARRRYAEEQQA